VSSVSTGSDSTDSGSDSSVEAATGDSSDNDDGEYCNEGDEDCDCEDDDSSSATATADASSSAPTDASSAPADTSSAPADTSSAPTDTSGTDNAGGDPNAGNSGSSSGSSSSSGGDGQTFTDGFATFFYQNGVAGACGNVNPDSALIAAIDQDRYGTAGGASSLCGKQIHITNSQNGKSVVVTVADDCPTCNNGDSIDLSTGAFDMIADEATGMVPISWYFM